MNRKDAESLYRDCCGDWRPDWGMLELVACKSRLTLEEAEESWKKEQREWFVSAISGEDVGDVEG